MRRTPPARIRTRTRDVQFQAGLAMDALEARALLTSTPLPLISDLTNPNNTVVRFETNVGDIYFELFDTAAPLTVANFLKYVRDGDYDKTFIHRKVDNFVVQGGAFRLKPNPTGSILNNIIDTAPTDPGVQNEFNQSNLARTLALARVGGQPNSGTNQWFVNLAANTNLDAVDGGFTVFGRVANDASWDILTAINGLTERNLDQQSTSTTALFAEVPLRAGSNTADGIQESDLVVVEDAEVVKPQGVAAFYTFKYYFPEGFAGSNISEYIPIGNPGGSAVRFQLIARSEQAQPQPTTGDFWFRDKVIATSSIAGNSRGGVTISQKSTPGQNLVDSGVPYALEVWSTAPLAVTSSHYDFGSLTGENFTTTLAETWALPEVRKGTGLRSYVLWQTVAEEIANLSVQFIRTGFDPITVPWSTLGFRRGGLDVSALANVPDGTYSVLITSDQPITASLTTYDTNNSTRGGSSTLGVSGRGSRVGVLPVASVGDGTPTGASATVALYNPGTAGAAVTLIFSFSDGTADVTNSPVFLQPGARTTVDLTSNTLLQNKTFSIRYSAGAQNIYASAQLRDRGDALASAFTTTAATINDFGEGFINSQRAGTNLFETLSVFNPNVTTLGQSESAAVVIFRFYYTDGTVVNEERNIAAGGRLDLDLTTFQPLLTQNASNRYFFSVQIVSDVPVIAELRHWDLNLGGTQPSGGDSYLGIQRGQIVQLGPTA